MTKTSPTKTDRLLERLRVDLRANRTWLMPLMGGFLLGRLTNALSDTNVKTVADAIMNSYGLDRPVNIVTWVMTVLLIMVPLCGYLLELICRKKGYETLFANLMTAKTDPLISPFAKGVITWGSILTIQSAPDLRYGWPLSSINILYGRDLFVMPRNHVGAYHHYVEENRQTKRFFDDGAKFMLVRNPVSFSDSATLVLDIHKTMYSEIHYYRDKVATIPGERDRLLRKAVEDLDIEFPHSLCMHAVIVTKDERVLLTKRSHKVSEYPDVWSISIEEQLSPLDIQGSDGEIMSRWARRLLMEELGLPAEQVVEDNFRVLSVFIEGAILNCSLAAVARLDLTSAQLNKMIDCRPRTDYEFSDWLFVSFDRLGRELLKPSRPLHPSSGYRSLLALVKKWGVPRLADTLFRSEKRGIARPHDPFPDA